MLTITRLLRDKGVVAKFVEFYGEGLDGLPLADRATIGNMSPEFGSTWAIFPIDRDTLEYLRLSGRSPERIRLVEAYARAGPVPREGLARPAFTDTLDLDLSTIGPTLAGPAAARTTRSACATCAPAGPRCAGAEWRPPAKPRTA